MPIIVQQIRNALPLLLVMSSIEVNCYVIMPPNSIENDQSYYLTQIVPPAKYRLVLWDALSPSPVDPHQNDRSPSGDRSLCHRDEMFCYFYANPTKLLFYTDVIQFQLDELAKCFVHFYTVETDEKGRFLVHKSNEAFDRHNFYIFPLKNSSPISGDDFAPYAAQQIILQGNFASDFLSRDEFDDRRYLLKYFDSANAWQMNANALLRHWLCDKFAYQFSDKQNFFLIANFKYLLDYAIRHKNIGMQMAPTEAKMLGTFWQFFSDAANANLLWKRLTLVDQRVVELTNQFCQIDKQYLLAQLHLISALRNLDNAMAFCQHWFVVSSKLKYATQTDVVMDAFRHWILRSKHWNAAFAEIVHFWIELFSKRTATKDVRHFCRWPEMEQRLFHQIGILFAHAKGVYALRLKTLNKIKGIKELLDKICANVKDLSVPCCSHNSMQMILAQWKTTVCIDGKFQYLLRPREQNGQMAVPELILHQNRQLFAHSDPHQFGCNRSEDEQRPKCVICLTEEVRVAMDPCGHFCVCGQCAETVRSQMSPKCPLCREKISKTIRIYQP